MKEIKAYLQPWLGKVESVIEDALRSDVSLLDATNRSLRENPGKMMRPSLALLCADAVGAPNDDTIKFAAAAELLHNATLLHDDVVDCASERRGRPTVASFLNPHASVLIGDYWLVKAVNTILGASNNTDRVTRIFAATLGHLAEGELLQMEKAVKGDTTQQDYERIIYCKTASLFEASALSAAVSVGAPEHSIQAIGEFARPLLCALEGADNEADIREKVTRIADNPELGHEVLEFVKSRGGIEKSALKVDQFIQKAIGQLDFLPEGTAKDRLVTIARFVGERGR